MALEERVLAYALGALVLVVLAGYLWALVSTLWAGARYYDRSVWREFGLLVVLPVWLPVWLVWVVGRAVWEALREVVRIANR